VITGPEGHSVAVLEWVFSRRGSLRHQGVAGILECGCDPGCFGNTSIDNAGGRNQRHGEMPRGRAGAGGVSPDLGAHHDDCVRGGCPRPLRLTVEAAPSPS